MKIVAIIQARMGSTRLPGKVMLPIGTKSMLTRVVRRVQKSQVLDQVIVATSTQPEDDRIVEECNVLCVPCYRGSEQDVLDRYYQAAKQYQADLIVRITADCPVIDPQVIDLVVMKCIQSKADYASNCLQRTYPRGLDTEVITFDALEKAWNEAKLSFQRSHVTPYIHRNPDLFKLESITDPSDASAYRWTVDTQEDLTLVRTIYQRLGDHGEFCWQDALMLMQFDPSLAAINQNVTQKPMTEG